MTTTDKIINITFDQVYMQLNKLLDNYNQDEFVPISEIPDILIEDFNEFNCDNTMSMIDDKPHIPYRDFRHWCNKLNSDGFDYHNSNNLQFIFSAILCLIFSNLSIVYFSSPTLYFIFLNSLKIII